MFTHETLFDEHQQQIDDAFNAEADRRKIAPGVARELLYDHVTQRVYRAPVTSDRLKMGDLAITVESPLLDGTERYEKNSPEMRHLFDNAASLLPGAPGRWLEGKKVPTPLVEALKLLLDPKGPEQELRRRNRLIREERRAQAARQHLSLLDDIARRTAEGCEAVRKTAWRAIPLEMRALLRAGNKTLNGNELAAAITAERDDLAPPAGWTPPAPNSQPEAPPIRNTTFVSTPSGSQTRTVRGIGQARIETWSETVSDAAKE